MKYGHHEETLVELIRKQADCLQLQADYLALPWWRRRGRRARFLQRVQEGSALAEIAAHMGLRARRPAGLA